MFKRLFAIAAVFIFLVAAFPAFAGQLFDSQTAINDALNNSGYYKPQNPDGENLNYVSIPILSDYLKGDSYYGCLVYGVPHGDIKDGQYRYLGYTLNGEDYTNVAFPPDVTHTGYFEDQGWIPQPWQDNDVRANYNIDFNNDLDGSDRYALNIRHGILIYYSDPNNANNYKVHGIDGSTREFWDNIQQYVHILAPPTKYAWGIGRMWRYGAGGQINYMTVPLLPDALLSKNNLVALRMHSGVEGEAEPGVRYTAAVDFQNQSDNPLTGVPVGAFHREWRAVLKDDSGNPVEYTGFAPGEVKTYNFNWTAPDDLSETILIAVIDADPVEDKFAETNEEDNVIEATVPIREVAFDSGNGNLTFQAYSIPGEDIYGEWHDSEPREPDTARWTDRVVATLTVPAPKPPKGKLVSWSITSASLAYPRQNPEFCFGNPVEPLDGDMVTIDMDIEGHTATAEFKENWSMAGFNHDTEAPGVYNNVTGELMAAEPKNYYPWADWRVEYTYEYQIPHRSCSTKKRSDGSTYRSCHTWYETVRKTGTASGTAAGRLTVDGAGAVSVGS